MGKKKNQYYGGKQNRAEKESFFGAVWEQAVQIYLFLMLAVYPLFMGRGYEELVYKKWALFLYASSAFCIVSTVCGAAALAGRRGRTDRKKGSERCAGGRTVTDWFVFIYLLCVVISYLGAVDSQTAFWGVDTWYMGLVSQVLFVGIYFGISRGYAENRYMKILAAAVAVIVGSIVILQRFDIDVVYLYQGYSDEVKLDFVTTLGQVTWASSYISILLTAGMGIYYLTEEKKAKIFWGICVGAGFASEMLLNSDSGMIAVFAALMVMLWLAVGSRKRLLALAEIGMIALTAVAAVGILERIFGGRMIPIDAVYLKAAQSVMVYVLLAIAAVFHLAIRKDWLHGDAKQGTVRLVRGIYILLVCLGIVGMSALFILHGKGYFGGSPTENYFRFTIWWGNSRGFIWRTGAAVFADFNVWRKLFGCGPDCFTPYSYQMMGDAINEFWHNQIVPNVHNEWFNGVINYGIVGGAAYLGIFLSSAYGLIKAALKGKGAVVFGIGLAAAAYIAHNVLCYQQIIGTPLIFILLGIGAAKVRAAAPP